MIASEIGDLVPDQLKGKAVLPNIAFPRLTKQQAPKHVMYSVEAMWLYKHAWRGAGLYYRKEDHQTDLLVTQGEAYFNVQGFEHVSCMEQRDYAQM